MTIIENLRAIRALIDTPDKWTREVGARDKDGVPVPVNDPTAACFSLLGAREAVCPYSGTYRACAEALPDDFRFLDDFNDHPDTTHADVIALVDRAIDAEESRWA